MARAQRDNVSFSPTECSTAIGSRVLLAQSFDALAFDKPNEATPLAFARNVEKLASGPAQFRRAPSVPVQKKARVIDRAPPIGFGNIARSSAVKTREGVEITFGNAARREAFALFDRVKIVRIYGGYAHRNARTLHLSRNAAFEA